MGYTTKIKQSKINMAQNNIYLTNSKSVYPKNPLNPPALADTDVSNVTFGDFLKDSIVVAKFSVTITGFPDDS